MLRATLSSLLLLAASPAFAAGSGGSSAEAPATMQWQVRDLTVTRRVAPAFPDGASLGALSEGVACRASVRIAGDGVPTAVDVSGCPDAFAEKTHEAVSQWRWAAWGSVAERRVSLSVKFASPVIRNAVALDDAPDALLAGPVPEPRPGTAPNRAVQPKADVPASPYSAAATRKAADGAGPEASGLMERRIVCSGTIARDRRGVGGKVTVASCPASYRAAALDAMKALRKAPASEVADEAPAKRLQPVSVTFTVADI